VGGNLAEEKKLLSLVWREDGGGFGGRNGGGVGCLWRRKKEEEQKKKICRGRGKTSRWLPLSPVRIWVRGEAEKSSVCGGERLLWGLQQLKTRWREL
jgi:hypothetical protein